MGHGNMTDYDKLEWIHFAIQEALNGNNEELEQALELIEDLRESALQLLSCEVPK